MTSEQGNRNSIVSKSADVDQQDQGPASHTKDAPGGTHGGEINATDNRDGAGKIPDDADAAGG